MEIKRIDYDFSICKVEDYSLADLTMEYCFFAKTDEENSIVCITEYVPENTTACDHGWKGVLEFSLIGILSELSTLLAENKIGIFAVSTYNTDYILTKKENYDKALEILSKAGYRVI